MVYLNCKTGCDRDVTELRWHADLPAEYGFLMMMSNYDNMYLSAMEGVSHTKYSSKAKTTIVHSYVIKGSNLCFLNSQEEIMGELAELPISNSDTCKVSPPQVPEISSECHRLQSVIYPMAGLKWEYTQTCADKHSPKNDSEQVDQQILSVVLKSCVTSFFTHLYDPYFINCVQYLPWEVPANFRMPAININATATGITRKVLQQIKNIILERSIKYNSHSASDLVLMVSSDQMSILMDSYNKPYNNYIPTWFGASKIDRDYDYRDTMKSGYLSGIVDTETGIRVFAVSSERIGRIKATGAYLDKLCIRGLDTSKSAFIAKDTFVLPSNNGVSQSSYSAVSFMPGHSSTMDWTYGLLETQRMINGFGSAGWAIGLSSGIFNFKPPLNVNIVVDAPTGSGISPTHTPLITDFTPTNIIMAAT